MPENHNFIEVDHAGPCFFCGLPTNMVEINFEAWLHLECETGADAAYWEALRD